mmetsp:Transcript_19725/g.44791  ORF Transcript_19725/g.44791 Transcript_19725/m.44791 type:complete len:354 (-) Transcript_19725:754-1815(-)
MDVIERYEHVHAPYNRSLGLRPTLGHYVLFPTSTDEQRRLGIETQGLGHDETCKFHLLDVFHGGNSVPHDPIDLLPDPHHLLRMTREFEEGPGEDGRSGLVSRDEHGHEIIAKLLVVHVGSAHVDEKAEEGGVLHFGVVAGLEVLDVFDNAAVFGTFDEIIEDIVEEIEVGVEFTEAGDQFVGEGKVPVGSRSHGAMFSLEEGAVNGLDDGRFFFDRTEFIIEDGLADNIQRHRTELLLHLNLSRGVAYFVEAVNERFVAVPEKSNHMVEPRLMKARNDLSPAYIPRDGVGGDEALAHDGFENFGEDALVIFYVLVAEDVTSLDRITDDQERSETLNHDCDCLLLTHYSIAQQ